MQKRNIEYSKEYAQFMEFMGGGRTLEEQVEDCERTGSHALHWVLRRQVLRSIGVKEAKADAQNFIIWSCYVPFWSTAKLRDTVTLLNTLGIEYNYSDKEMCCGAPMIQDSIELEGVTEDQKKKMLAKSQEMMRHNVEIAEKAGQKIMVYACQVCACLAKKAFSNEPERHHYIYDTIMDKMEKIDLQVAPMTIGFFEGCHRYYPHNSNLDWKRYRKLLESVKGMEVVTLPQKICCKQDANAILANAEKNNLKTIVAPDGDCHHFLKAAATARGGNIEIKNLPEILVSVLGK